MPALVFKIWLELDGRGKSSPKALLSAGLIDRPRGDNATETHDHKNNEGFDRIVADEEILC